MYRFLRTPRWLVAHVIVLAVAATCVSLGLWQLRRLDERREFNASVEAGLAAEPAPLADVLGEPASSLAYRRVIAQGRYLADEEVLLSVRSRNGAPGHHVLTPLDTGEGGIVVDRGWVPYSLSTPPVIQAAPPEGEVTVRGFLLPSRVARRASEDFVSEVDVQRLQAQVSIPLAPVYLVLQSQTPASGDLPLPGEPPALGEGPHLSYAVQWFIFATIALGGYPLLIRRQARDRAAPPGAPRPSRPTSSASAPPPSRTPR